MAAAKPAAAEPAAAQPAAEPAAELPDLPAASSDIAAQPPKVEGGTATAAAPAAAPASMAATSDHVVVAGDTFWDIAEKVYGAGAKWHAIAEANPEFRAPLGSRDQAPDSKAAGLPS